MSNDQRSLSTPWDGSPLRLSDDGARLLATDAMAQARTMGFKDETGTLLRRVAEQLLARLAISETERRPNLIPLLQKVRRQRDGLADVLRDIDSRGLLSGFGGTEHRVREALKDIPDAEQQLRNIAEWIGMDYDELRAALANVPEAPK